MNWSVFKQRMYQLRMQPLVTADWILLGSEDDIHGPRVIHGPRALVNPPNTLFRLLDTLPRP